MQLRWTEEAVADLEHIAGYLLTHTPSRAQNLIRAVYEAPSDLLTFPNRGRQGKKEGTRELVLSPLPYIVVYKVLGRRHLRRPNIARRAEVALAR